MTERLYTKKDADYCLWYIRKYVCAEAKLIGSFGKGAKTSKNDIDILLPPFVNGYKPEWNNGKILDKKTSGQQWKKYIKELLDAKRVETTDWGGWFFHNTAFGNVDIFFDITHFDY